MACSLDEFFALFLADNAPHAIDHYQRDFIGDSELSVSPWLTEQNGIHVRLIKFRHPLPNGLGVGPASALAERHQRFKRYGDHGFCIETSTNVKGIIASDCFYVDDKWIVEATGETNVKLTVKHQVRFTKRTMLKRLIQNASNTEAQTWYEGYSKMLLESLKDKGPRKVLRRKEELQKGQTEAIVEGQAQFGQVADFLSNNLLMPFIWGCFMAVFGFLLLQMASVNGKLEALENELTRLHEEHLQAFARLEEAIGAMNPSDNATR